MITWPRVPIDFERGWDMCFGCGKYNPIGLKLKFQQDGNIVRAEFTPNNNHQGWSGIVHGGLLFTLLDEAMGYAVLYQGLSSVTAKMHARLKHPAVIGEPLVITGSITGKERKLITAEAAISLKDGTPVAEATGTMYVIGQMPGDDSKKEEKPKNDTER
ncbi:hypothetical protein ES707_04667 [subsurface metagenome]